MRKSIETIAQEAEAVFLRAVDNEVITNARRADEYASDLASEYFSSETTEYEYIVARLFDLAGGEFPGNWEDYDVSV